MQKSGKDIYGGAGIIPACPSGRRLWEADVIIDGRTEGVFLFNVDY